MTSAVELLNIINESKKIEEISDEKVKEIIKDLIDTDWSKDNESQGRAVSLLKGLAFSDNELANKFMKALDKASSGLKSQFTEE